MFLLAALIDSVNVSRPTRHRMDHYRAMHYSAKRGLAIACRPSVRLSVCDVGGS